MVNIINESNTLNDEYSLFSLTKPLPPLQTNNYPKLNGFKMNNNNNKNTTLFNDSSFNFTFLEPFESYHLKHKYSNGASNGGKLLNKTLINQRKQPYTLGKPSQPVVTQQPSKNIVETADENDTKQNGFNQNAILARLSSISSTFKSIFVRPKNTKLVDIKSIQNDTLLNTKSKQESEPTKFKLELFSCSSTIPTNDVLNNNKNESQFDINNKLENIIKQNVLMESLNSSRNLISKTNEQHQKLTNNLLNSPHSSSSSSSSSTKSTLSTTSNLTTDSLMLSAKIVNKTSETHQRASMMTIQLNNQSILKTSNNPSLINNNTNNNNNANTLQNQQKWTCLICLSKHKLDVKICNICGSLQQNTNHSTSSSSNKPKFQKLNQKESHSTTSSQSSANCSQLLNNSTNNQYLVKTWTCYYCNYANDCLKIVCMNCRSSKQQQLNEIKTSLSHQTIQLKRARNQTANTAPTTVTNGVKYKLNTSNEENELNESADDLEVVNNKKSKKIKCSQCSSCSHSNTTSTSTNNTTSNTNTNNPSTPLDNQLKNSNLVAKLNGTTGSGPNLITPTKPSNYNKYDNATNVNEAAQLLNSNLTPGKKKTTELVQSPLAKPSESVKPLSTSKWTCSTCLVQNDESKSSCACCCTSRPNIKDTVDSKKQPSSLSSTLPTSSKWTCSTCLVSNEAEKEECACCMTKRNLSSSSSLSSNQLKSTDDSTSKTKFSTLVAAAGSNVLTLGNNMLSLPSTNTDSSISKSISFGLKPNEAGSIEPIKFGSNSSIFTPKVENKQTTPSFGILGHSNKSTEPVQSFGTVSMSSSSSSNSNGVNGFAFMNTPTISSTNTASANSAPLFGTSVSSNTSSNSTSMFGSVQTASFVSSQTTNEEKPKFFLSTTPASTDPSPFSTNSSSTTTTATATSSFFGSSTLPKVTDTTQTPTTFQFGNNSTSSNINSQTPTPASTPAFTFGTNTTNGSSSSSFFNNTNTTTTSTAPVLFGGSTQKESNGSFQINNPFTNKNEPNKPAEITTTIKTEKPNNTLLKFGFTNSASSSSINNTTTNNNQSSSVFSTNNNGNNNLFGSSSNNNSNSSTFNFGNNSNKTSEPAKLPQPTFTFGQSNSNSAETKPPVISGSTSSSSTSNVFGTLLSSVQQQPSSAPTTTSTFKFGQSNVSTPSTTSNSSSAFVFGGSSTASNNTETTKLSAGFNFGSSQPSFNFNSAATTGTDLNMTPKRPETPSSNTTPFVFGGGGGAPQQGTNNLQQILTPSTTTPGQRQIKKPTRRLKK